MARNSETISGAVYDRFADIIRQLESNWPIQYILGYTEFYGLNFMVDKRVLIPRQETEELVDMVIRNERFAAPVILDIGTGSGCIAVTLKKKLASSEVHACDLSDEALEVAAKNAAGNNAEIEFFTHDIKDGSALPGHYDVIISNPPYVRQSEMNMMHRNVLDHEPGIALFVPDDDPLLYYRHIAKNGMASLRPGGRLYLEINENLPDEMRLLLQQAGYVNVSITKDLNGKPRIAYAVRI